MAGGLIAALPPYVVYILCRGNEWLKNGRFGEGCSNKKKHQKEPFEGQPRELAIHFVLIYPVCLLVKAIALIMNS